MAEEKENVEQEVDGPLKKPRDIRKLMIMSFLVINLVAVGGALYLVYANTIGYVADPIGEQIAREKYIEQVRYFDDKPIVYTMDPFVVNLSGQPNRTIQLELSLEMLNEKGYEEVITKTTEARDKIVKILNEKSFTELESIQGKLILKDQISLALNQYLHTGVVKGIYFTNFVVQ